MTQATSSLPIAAVRFVKELYPRLRPSDETIARYQETLDDLPPIVVARDGVLVDGYHRWQAHLRSGRQDIAADDLGNLTDAEIFNESIARNAHHGMALSRDDKRDLAPRLWQARHHLPIAERVKDIAQLLATSVRTVQDWTQDIRAQEKAEQQALAWDLWLNCHEQQDIAERIGVDKATVSRWLQDRRSAEMQPPDPHMAFDYWIYNKAEGDTSYFGAMPSGIVENLLWLFTQPGDTVVDPFAGSGTTIHVAKGMGRRVWASDRSSSTKYPHLPIHTHDITTGWPEQAPRKANLILLDPPYWIQAAGRYSDDQADLANMPLPSFYEAWAQVVKHCAEHLDDNGRLAFIVSPAQDGTLENGRVEDLAFGMYRICEDEGLTCERRIVVPYNTQQANGQQVDAARKHRKLLKLYRDLVVMRG